MQVLNHERGFAVDEAFLAKRVGSGLLGVSKWIQYCRFMLKRGYKVTLYEARQTVSKYVTVHHGGKHYTVRFSNHKPNRQRELNGDCDMFVGVSHTGCNTINDAIRVCLCRLEGDHAGEVRREAVRTVVKEEPHKVEEESVRGASGQMDLFAQGEAVHHRVQAQERGGAAPQAGSGNQTTEGAGL